MSNSKVRAVLEWPSPTSAKSLESFLGFANFYRRFICSFSATVAPLMALTSSKCSFVWSTDAQQAFDALKAAFTTASVLQHPDPEHSFNVEADASDITVGAVLLQSYVDSGLLHPVAYHSRKLTPYEQNYTITERELLAVRDAFLVWRPLGYSHPSTHLQ